MVEASVCVPLESIVLLACCVTETLGLGHEEADTSAVVSGESLVTILDE